MIIIANNNKTTENKENYNEIKKFVPMNLQTNNRKSHFIFPLVVINNLFYLV